MKQFSWGAIFRGAIFLGGIFLGGFFPGGNFLGGLFPGGFFPGGIFPDTIFLCGKVNFSVIHPAHITNHSFKSTLQEQFESLEYCKLSAKVIF